jgi:hypothetical protein
MKVLGLIKLDYATSIVPHKNKLRQRFYFTRLQGSPTKTNRPQNFPWYSAVAQIQLVHHEIKVVLVLN